MDNKNKNTNAAKQINKTSDKNPNNCIQLHQLTSNTKTELFWVILKWFQENLNFAESN
jgi:hypothetical protein